MDISMKFYKYLFTVLLSFTLTYSSVFAESNYSDIQLLIKQGQFKEALKLTEDQLSRNTADIKLQFMKGLVLTRLERYDEAEKVFMKLTKENPQLPEPYNNLAVVYAAQGKYAEAEKALQAAINTHPSYATAHENLGDIYAKMASKAYNQALELDTTNQTAREKLSLVNELISAPTKTESLPEEKPEKTVVAKAPETKTEKTPEKSVPKEPEVIVIPAKEEPKPQKEEKREEIPAPVEQVEPVDEEAELIHNRKAVETAVLNWANAWSAQDVNAYIASYGNEFVPPKKMSRKEWEKERRIRLKRPSFIKVTLTDMKINLHGKDYAEVRFNQAYLSDTYGDKVNKELLMRKINDKWLITQERTR